MRGSQVQNNALKLQARSPEIEQQAQVSSGRAEVVDALCTMGSVERPHGFQSDQNRVCDQEFDKIFPHQDAFVCDRDCTLLLDGNAGYTQPRGQPPSEFPQ